jgi:hypothetical protein
LRNAHKLKPTLADFTGGRTMPIMMLIVGLQAVAVALATGVAMVFGRF